MKKIVFTILSILLIGWFLVCCWFLIRKINYSLSYKSMVENTVREMVKEEALKRP